MAIKLFNVLTLSERVGKDKRTNFYKRLSACFNSGNPELTRDEVKSIRTAIQTGTKEALETLKTLEKK